MNGNAGDAGDADFYLACGEIFGGMDGEKLNDWGGRYGIFFASGILLATAWGDRREAKGGTNGCVNEAEEGHSVGLLFAKSKKRVTRN